MSRHKVLDFFITFLVWWAITLPIHELGHALGAALGGYSDGYVTYDLLRWTGTHFVDPAPMAGSVAAMVWSISGGLFTALVMGLLWWRAWASPCRWDLDDEATLAIVGLGQVLYGISEMLPGGIWQPVFILAGVGAGLAIYFPRMLRWWESEEV